ncbi:MAG: hypothetical protein LBL48_01535, partial [Azoarcus sp.]|nr:hypothetical protein [Azoarcus sp.]
MPQPITIQELQNYKHAIEAGGVNAVKEVYADLYSKGYSYAGWAEGVVKENTVAGLAAMNYMKDSAFHESGVELTQNQIDKIKVDMALQTISQYIKNADNTGGSLTTDLNYEDTKNIHKNTFEDNDLSLTNWTLNIPMEIIREKYGDAVVEKLWEHIRDTGGDGLDATVMNSSLFTIMLGTYFSDDPAMKDMVAKWLEYVIPHIEEKTILDALLNLSKTLGEIGESINDLFLRARDWVPPRDPLALDLDGDGIETIGIGGANTVLFDHDGNGIRTGTGWLKPDDAFLVLDRNGNGKIDNGGELFGVDTVR